MNLTRTSRLTPAAAAAVAAMAALALSASPALASGHSILRADLVGSMPAPDSPQIAGINPGGAPWVNGPSSARVREDGRIMVSITGLVIPPPRGTNTNPIASVVATLVCGDMVRSSTAPFALSPAGDGSTSGRIAGTHRCKDPVLLIQPAGNRAVYIASAMGDHDDD
jgi:hypothetical protein